MSEPRHPAESLVHRGRGHVEFFDLSEAELRGLDALLEPLAAEGCERFSFHAPIVRPFDFPHRAVACFFLCEDAALRERSFELLAESLAEARRWGASHVVTHLTYGPGDCRDPLRATALARTACERMGEMSAAEGVRLDVEFAAYSDGFHCAETFVDVVAAAGLGVCLDVGHVYLGARRRGREYLADVALLAPLARSLHLWNTRGRAGEGGGNGHVPLHPSQHPREGWIDLEAVFRLLADRMGRIDLVFEYPVSCVTPEIAEGYAWAVGLAAECTAAGVPRKALAESQEGGMR